MKGSGALVASVVAASSVIAKSLVDSKPSFSAPPKMMASAREAEPSSTRDKFAPRFDGLRFIETLVTAHR